LFSEFNQQKHSEIMKNDLQKHALFRKIMKLTLHQLIILLILTGVSFGGTGISNAQDVLHKQLSLDIKDQPIKEVLSKIESKANVKFAYTREAIDSTDPISIKANNEKLYEVLDKLLKPRKINYQNIGQQIVLNKYLSLDIRNLLKDEDVQELLSGKVTTEDGDPIPGVNIVLKGTTTGMVTDIEGHYSLLVPDLSGTLIFSYIGYKSIEVPINGRTTIDVTLIEDVQRLGEVVVVGYNSQANKDITGSVSVVDMEALKSIPANSAAQALQGQSSGVNVINSGVPGGRSNINIRGISSFGDTQPLVLVDGVQADINDINASDIESMQVLKDAGAAAIYGVRGSNGVIIITTKKGKSGAPKLNYDTYYGMQLPLRGNVFNLLNSQDFARLTKVANPGTSLFKNGMPDFMYRGSGGSGVAMAGDAAVDPSKYFLDPFNSSNNYLIQEVNKLGTDWFHEIFKVAPMQNHNLTLSGGTDKSNYLLSLGYLNQQGTLIETFLKRYSARVNTEFKLKRNIRVGQNAYLFYRQNKDLSNGNPISWTYRTMPIIPVYDIKGNFGGTFAGPELGASSNPVAVQKNKLNDRSNSWNVVGNVYAEVDFLQHFTARTSFGGALENQYYTNFNFTRYNNTEGNNDPNSFNENALYNSNTIWTNTINYDNIFGNHNVKVMIGSEAIRNYGRSIGGSRTGFFSTDINYLVLNTGTENVTNYSNAYENTLFSLFSNLNYSYDDKYLLGLTVRRDGSSKFGSEKRYGVFPSFSAGWRISNESFMKNVDWVNDLKIKGSYGILGSQNNVSPDNAYSLYGGNFRNAYYDITGSSNSIQQGFFQTRIGNPNTKWEQNIISNLGFDATLLNYKVDFSFEYYKKSINGLLFSKPLPATVGGATPPTVNIGDIQNTGFDISARYEVELNTDLQFTIGTNVTTYKNKVVAIPGPGYFDAAGTQVLGNVVRNQEGEPVSSFFGYDVIGLFKDEDDVSSSPTQTDAAPGRFKYRDVNRDGTITPDDRTFIGNPNPDFTYGLNLGLNYRGFDFSAIFYGSEGNEVHNQILNYTHFFSGYAGGKSNVLLNAWTPENTNTNIPKIESQGSFSTSGVANSYYIEDGSYLRLKSLIFGYSIHPDILQKYSVNKLRLYVQAANLFTFTKYTGLDPELGGSSSAFGVDYAYYPNNEQSFLLGINVSF
jgi:TonB-linked SusC/RagA family outer membrane protein